MLDIPKAIAKLRQRLDTMEAKASKEQDKNKLYTIGTKVTRMLEIANASGRLPRILQKPLL